MQRVRRLHYTAEHPFGLQFIFLTHPASAWPFSPPFFLLCTTIFLLFHPMVLLVVPSTYLLPTCLLFSFIPLADFFSPPPPLW